MSWIEGRSSVKPQFYNQIKQKVGSRITKSLEDIINDKSVQGKYTLEIEGHYTDEGYV